VGSEDCLFIIYKGIIIISSLFLENEFLFLDYKGGLSIYNADTFNVSEIVKSTTIVSLTRLCLMLCKKTYSCI